ncbi:MAG: hypothetical protein EXS08_10580 [Planctomycetes bacterium]|nr:hypothetical protein [Planctomycetota bacterium]
MLSSRCLPVRIGFLAVVLAPLAQAGNVLRVGPGQPFADVQSAVNAASSGDFVRVEPGLYPPFVVDGKELSIVAAGASFALAGTSGQPELTVQNVPAGRTVTIHGVHIDFADKLAPAVLVANNAGAVRLSALEVEPSANLFDASVTAAVRIENTATFWLIDSAISSNTIRLGNTLNPLCVGTRCNDGLSALELVDSSGAIHNTRLRGYMNDYTALGCGGDGLRALGNCHLRLYENGLPRTAMFAGGDGVFGGSAVHQVRTPPAPKLIQSCSLSAHTPLYIRGTGVAAFGGEPGGFYAVNNDNGAVSIGGQVVFQIVDHCPFAQRNEVVLEPRIVPLGGTLDVHLRNGRDSSFVLLIADATRHDAYPGFGGRGLLDPTRLLLLRFGTTPKNVVASFSFPVLNSSALIGLQLAAQSVSGPLGGALRDFSVPSLTVIGP